ncbi:hypothetical protein [Variovorax saccharolyticus]|uniref:hypothetical protein n=1 Tax=Variovorax saccharolyticus TaxID=3053516 RepID=UPI002575C447|nr:hypothetical protein [Variovorax sp. J31P216]MDM0028986.1 hypothetical protein [Variovorax sp. J31P216]
MTRRALGTPFQLKEFLMRFWCSAVTAVALAGLAACGGGGGGGGGVTPILPAQAMNLSVAINGKTAAPDGAGQYAAKPGDTIEITPSIGADWAASAADPSAITLRSASSSSTKWSAQLVNNTTAPVVYTVTAKQGSAASITKDAVFKVSGGNSQNGSYRVWATNGTQSQLALNFDTGTYDMTDSAGQVSSDSFAADPGEQGTYVLKSARLKAAYNAARFRATGDAVVGSFPFDDPQLASTATVQPFVASRAPLTAQADLDGTYTRLGVNYGPGLRDSQIRRVQLSAGGTVFQQCNDAAVVDMANCTPANLITYAVTPAPNNGWSYVNVANPVDKAAFTVAYVGGQRVMLASGLDQTGSQRVFRIGVIATAPTANTARGGTTDGGWGALGFDPVNASWTVTKADGSSDIQSLAFSNLGYPAGLQSAGASPNAYFFMQNSALSVAVGARGNNGAGYMHFGLVN